MLTYKFQKLACAAYALLFSAALVSCKNDNVSPEATAALSLKTASYSWGDLSISRTINNDVIHYNSAGQPDTIVSTDGNSAVSTIVLSYSGNKITLNTPYKESFTLDAQGRVLSHSNNTDPSGAEYLNETQEYEYDAGGYLHKVSLKVGNREYSVITYQIKNGNYISYKLSSPDGSDITRQYNFSYSSKKVFSSAALFTAIFANNTRTGVEKYLNFGKQSVNLLREVDYTIINLDKSVQRGTLSVISQVDDKNNLLHLSLSGGGINGMPSDNLSPLPRSVSFVLNN
jgi:hypothetical protein